MKNYMKSRRQERRNKLLVMSGEKCLKCGSTDKLEFDHRDRSTKEFTLSGAGLDTSWDRILIEHKKCDLLCDSCHKEKSRKCSDITSGGLNKNNSPYVCGSPRTYSELKCRCNICKKAKSLYRDKKIKYTDVIK